MIGNEDKFKEICAQIDDLYSKKEMTKAVRLIEYGLAFWPFSHALYRARARIFHGMSMYIDAARDYASALVYAGDNSEDLISLASTHYDMGRYDLANDLYGRAEAVCKGEFKGALKRGATLWELGDWDSALQYIELALKQSPRDPTALWVRSLLRLQQNNFRQGWIGYDARWKSNRFKSGRLVSKKPKWVPNKGLKSVLVWGEQGVGDQLFYSSLLPTLRKNVDSVYFFCDKRIIPLLSRCMPDVNFVGTFNEMSDVHYDSNMPIASIGSRFIRKLSDIPKHAARKYLSADPERVKKLREELNIQPGERLIGLSWTSAAFRIGGEKSMLLEDLYPVLKLPGFRFINVQYAERPGEVDDFAESSGIKIERTSVNCKDDFEGLAALLTICDCLVMVSSTTVHLAGALGCPVLLMDSNKLWYWGNRDNNSFSYWYPSVKVFSRKNVLVPWGGTVMAVKDELMRRKLKEFK